ncbi:hypothetical protein HKX48_001916 [Thoreauomyces humboldtii]|nr:hypothetical protein HKX48_001916 [Thoreauomyces humboldtii]
MSTGQALLTLPEGLPEGGFYGSVRENTVVLLFSLPALAAASTVIRRYKHRGNVPPPRRLSRTLLPGTTAAEQQSYLESIEGPDDDDEVATALVFCSVGLAAALSGLVLLLVTSAFQDMVAPTLLQRFWNCSFIASSVSLYGLMPFCYLYLEANGTTWFAKTKECLQVASLFWTLGLGFVYVTTRLLGVEALMESHPWLSALNILTSIPCGLLCAVATPKGGAAIFRFSASIALPLNHRTQITGQIAEREFDIMALENEAHALATLAPATTSTAEAHAHEVEMLTLRIAVLRKDIFDLRREEQKDPLVRVAIVLVLFSLASIGWIAVMLRITLSLADHVLSSSLRPWGPDELPPKWWTVSESVALAYFSIATTVGIYQLVPKLRLQAHGTPTRHIVGNITLLLLISMALPLVSRALGVASSAYGPYAEVPLFRNHPWAMSCMKAVGIWLLGPARTF